MSVVNLHASNARDFTTVDELKQKADIIAEIEINQSQATLFKDVVFTLSDAQIIKTFKGTAPADLNILETGGIFQNKKFVLNDNEAFSKGHRADCLSSAL